MKTSPLPQNNNLSKFHDFFQISSQDLSPKKILAIFHQKLNGTLPMDPSVSC